MAFLLALGANPNALNNEICSPLHLAVRSVENHGSERNVKALLLHGALRNLRDHERSLPIDYCNQIEDPNMYNDMIQILAQPSSWMCCLLKNPLEKVRRSRKVLVNFYILIFINYLGMFMFVFQYVDSTFFIIHSILSWFLVIIMVLLSMSNPGYVKRNRRLKFQQLIETNQLDKVCPICEIALTSRIRHCRFCNRCVENYDHHCPWINNWVGVNNHNLFYVFLVILMLFLLYNIVFSVLHVGTYQTDTYEHSFLYLKALQELFDEEWIYRIFLIVNIMCW